MPRHDYLCPDGHIFERYYREVTQNCSCPECGQDAHITYTTPPRTQSSLLDNQWYNNGFGGYDRQLDAVVSSRRQHEKILEERGLEYKGRMEYEEWLEYNTPEPPPEITEEEVAEEIEKVVSEVKKGKIADGWTAYSDRVEPPPLKEVDGIIMEDDDV